MTAYRVTTASEIMTTRSKPFGLFQKVCFHLDMILCTDTHSDRSKR
jgi:hypothetical protein